jgi:hypothetical protein
MMLIETEIEDDEDFSPSVPTEPPAPRAPTVLEHLQTNRQSLAALEIRIAEIALAAVEGRADAKADLAALHGQIATAAFQIDCSGRAHELAMRLDEQAIIDWKAAVQAMPPEKIVAGISKTDCCNMCRTDTGCVISGAGCAHPIKIGSLSPGQQGNPTIRNVYVAACRKTGR